MSQRRSSQTHTPVFGSSAMRRLGVWAGVFALAGVLATACGPSDAQTEDDDSGQSGGADASGGGTAGFNPTTTGGGDGGGFESCAEASEAAKQVPVNMFIAVDKSGSMDNGGKWTSAKAAFTAFFTDPEADALNVALRFWPYGACDPNSCSINACSQPQVPLGSLADANHEAALINLFNQMDPGGLTPMSAALAGATQWAVDNYTASDGVEKAVVVLLTDGNPTACDENINNIAQYAADAYAQAEVLTFAVGLQGSNEAQMDVIASAGQTGSGFFIGNGNAQGDLLLALKEIQKSAVACSFAMPVGEDPNKKVDPNKVNVTYTPSGSDEAITVPQVTDANACQGQDGWYYDNPANPALINLCPTTCAKVQDDEGVTFEILIGCDTTTF